MEACFAVAEEAINKQAVRALTALAAPQWTPSVIGTAAAMVAETARHLSAQQIIAQVCCFVLCMQSLVLVFTDGSSTHVIATSASCIFADVSLGLCISACYDFQFSCVLSLLSGGCTLWHFVQIHPDVQQGPTPQACMQVSSAVRKQIQQQVDNASRAVVKVAATASNTGVR